MKIVTVGLLFTYFHHTFTMARVYSSIKNTVVNHTEPSKQEGDKPVTTPLSRKQGDDIICGLDSFETNYYDCDAENQEQYKLTSNPGDQVSIDYFEDITDNDYIGLAESVTEKAYIPLAKTTPTTTKQDEVVKSKNNQTVNCVMANCNTVLFVEKPALKFYNMTTEVVWLQGTKPEKQTIPLDYVYKKTSVTFNGNLSSTEPPMETEPPPKTSITRSTTLRSYRSTIGDHTTTRSSPKSLKSLNNQKRFIRKLRKPA